MIIKYKHFNNLWERIGNIYEDSPFLQTFIWISIVFVPIIFALIFICSLKEENAEKTKNMDRTNVYTHIIVVERTNGLIDTIKYHDFEHKIKVELKEFEAKNPVVITTHGKNWLGAEVDNEIRIEECVKFKIIK